MSEVSVQLQSGKMVKVVPGTTVKDLLQAVMAKGDGQVIAAKVNGQRVALETKIDTDSQVEWVMDDTAQQVHATSLTCAHLVASALSARYPQGTVKLGALQASDASFFVDLELPSTLSIDDLSELEREVRQLAARDLKVRRFQVSLVEAWSRLQDDGQSLQMETLVDLFPLPGEFEGATPAQWPNELALVMQDGADDQLMQSDGQVVDLVELDGRVGLALGEGPLLASTGGILHFKLLSVGGAYWRGDATRPMLQRVQGIAFADEESLLQHLDQLELAKQRDHRKLGKELDLFLFLEDAPGMPFYLQNGLIVRNLLENYERSLQARDYQEVRTPMLLNQRLWQESGHWDHYRQNMFVVEADDAQYALKPMNCPGHMLLFKERLRSYRDLPIRVAEYGNCHRNELSGALGGMMRVRAFTQDDAHIFVRPDQIEREIQGIAALVDQVYGTFGFSYDVELSTRPDDSMGTGEQWDNAEAALAGALRAMNMVYTVNPGDGAFYGPKIDFHVKDALDRRWQCATIQLDFQLPLRFDLSYIGKDNQKHRPVVIHRAIYGSIDRFLGILTEHLAGVFPVWLAPKQVVILPVAAAHEAAAEVLCGTLHARGLRAYVDHRSEKLAYRIREAQAQKVPQIWVLGDKEVAGGTVAIRRLGDRAHVSLTVDEAVEGLAREAALPNHRP